MQFFLIFAVLIAILAVMFAVQNTAVVTIVFLANKFEGSLALVLLITFGLGVIMSLLLSIPSAIKKTSIIAHYKKRLREFEKNRELDEDEEEDKDKEKRDDPINET